MYDWVGLQTWRQHIEDLQREVETWRLAKALRDGDARRSLWAPVLWWELRRYGGRVRKVFGSKRAERRDHKV